MGKILLYAGGGYVVLVLLSSALFTGPGSLPLLVVAGIAFFLYRSGHLRTLRPRTAARLTPAPTPPPGDDRALEEALRYARRFDGAGRRLADALPEDPLENDALVAVLALYLHEPAEARENVENEYRARREEFLAWRQSVSLLGSPQGLNAGDLGVWLQGAKELDARLSAVEAYLADVQSRADAAENVIEQALERLARAGDAIRTASATASSITDTESARALNESLAGAEAKYQEAWRALEKGKERPVSAISLADEAAALAEGVQGRAARITGLPAEVARLLRELETSIETENADLGRVRADFETAASSYAPSCWREIGGVGQAAGQDLERARRLHGSAARLARSSDLEQLERAEQEAHEAGLAVADATRLREAIERHLEKLETAAVGAREVVLRAEQEIDRAWADVHERGNSDGDNELLRRATDLVQRARDGLAGPQPDWLAIFELADRGSRLAGEARVGASREPAGLDSLRIALDDAKARAKDSRDSAWAQAIVRPATADSAPSLLEATEDSYQAALRLDASLGESPDEDSLESAIGAFEGAHKTAAAFLRAATSLEDEGGAENADDARAARTLVWDLDLTRTTRA
ncbi:MAG TPA: hypothetical protein VD695_08625 [Gaiellaceae bacterium]|nr:hypothetical protein [Gaiellaceae bacterium]